MKNKNMVRTHNKLWRHPYRHMVVNQVIEIQKDKQLRAYVHQYAARTNKIFRTKAGINCYIITRLY